MITYVAGNWYNEYYGLSTDEKPTVGVPNASFFYEFDTTEVYVFDRASSTWIKQ